MLLNQCLQAFFDDSNYMKIRLKNGTLLAHFYKLAHHVHTLAHYKSFINRTVLSSFSLRVSCNKCTYVLIVIAVLECPKRSDT